MFDPKQVVLASSNQGKLAEFQALFAGAGVDLVPQSQFSVTDADEVAATFVENAIIKARHAAQQTKLPALADDSGLVVPALGGAPGVLSARYAGSDKSDGNNIEKLLAKLINVPEEQRQASFVCVLVFLRHADDPIPLISTGIWDGRILTASSGANGFGYDPIFHCAEYGCSAAELPADIKNQISHRYQATLSLLAQLNQARK